MCASAFRDGIVGIHDRKAVILNSEERDAWLGGSEDLSLGAEAALKCWPVRRFALRLWGARANRRGGVAGPILSAAETINSASVQFQSGYRFLKRLHFG